MYFVATGTITHPDEIGPHMPEEIRVLDELREQGVVKEVFRLAVGSGVINILEAGSLEEARAHLGRLPFVALGFMNFEYAEVARLQPSRDR
ncbi:hypothetical protein [Streptosporangium sp. 'caverna']|uniref:hypothetical protein n=1 Tax=Streptosporangium sp. 'caverna' TaxID=2202249 RepID=UPI000D7D4E42|nr:hypothetical protein [Streptosporangium sp. 'caverna']AWS45562.1 hypothetical protein DKM19_33785 [Streptosporangium sp. 'caverna']